MSKQSILGRRSCFGSAYCFLDGKTIKEVIQELNEYLDEGWSEDSKFDVDYSEDAEIELIEYRLETDEEYANRVSMEEYQREVQLQAKKRQYEQLKQELGL